VTGATDVDRDCAAARVELQRAQLVLQKRPADALASLLEAKRLDPRSVEILLELARVQLRLGRFADALECFSRVLALDGACPEALALAALCHLRLENHEAGLADASRALDIEPGDLVAAEVLADCHRALGRWHEAAAACRAVLARLPGLPDPRCARVSLKLAQCLLRLGMHQEAWERTGELVESGYADSKVRALRREALALSKGALMGALGKTSLVDRMVLFLADKHLLRAQAAGRRSVDPGQHRNDVPASKGGAS